jgi:branched-chain amino acid transport system substrate-binding protein
MKDWGNANKVEVTCFAIDPGSVDPTSAVLQAAATKPDAIVIDVPKEAAVPLYAAAEAQDLGSRFRFVGPTSQYNEGFPKAIGPYWEGKAHVQLELEPLNKKSPDNLNWRAVLDTYATAADQRDTFSQAGYLAARIATDALLGMDVNKIDRKSVTEAFRAVKKFKSDMMCGQWYFGPGDEHNANHRGSVSVVEKGGFVVKESCVEIDDPALANILKTEKSQNLVD